MESVERFSPGTIVANRNRLWRVDAQRGDVLLATPIDGADQRQRQFYTPLEQIERSSLPSLSANEVGSPQAQKLLLQAYRFNLLHGTAPLLSLQRSRAIPKDYQLVPVVMALEMGRVRLLLADDVGLGKTIEAGLVITELMARQMAHRILIVVPAALREQWREALDYFFHIDARIISSRHRREMERTLPLGANPWEYYPVLITSVDYAKQPAIKNQILEQSWDLVLFDEAHLAAKPHQIGEGKVKMERWSLARQIATSERVRHLLLLTATPHNGYTDSFASLLTLLDVQATKGNDHDPRIVRSVAQRHICQRRREDVDEWFADDPDRSPFPRRDQDEVIVTPTRYEGDAITAVREYGDGLLNAAARASRAQTKVLTKWTVLHLHKRALSSPYALLQSLRNRRAKIQQRLKDRNDELVPIDVADARDNVLDQFSSDRIDEEEAARRTERYMLGHSAEQLKAELTSLETVIEKVKKVTARRDSKLQKLLDTTLRNAIGRDPKVVIFTRYVDTLNYLEREIGKDKRYKGIKVLVIYGSLNERQRGEVFQKFEAAKRAVLIATDAISEGINLQQAAGQIIHYELPWNPNRLEQRNGRVDRFGQPRSMVHIRTMVMDDTLDATILQVLVKKAAQIRKDYGFAPPYFGDETDIIDLIQDHHQVQIAPRQLSLFDRSPTEEMLREGESKQDPFAEQTLERIRSESFYGQTHITLPEVEKRLHVTNETVGSAENIQQFLFSGLNYFGCRTTDNSDGTWRLWIDNPELQAVEGDNIIKRATFDAQLGLNDPEVTVIDLGHWLVRRLIEEIKQRTFHPSEKQYGRSSVVYNSGVDDAVAVFHLLTRHPVVSDPPTLVETLLPVAINIFDEARLPATVIDAINAAPPSPNMPSVMDAQEYLEDALTLPWLDTMLGEAVAALQQQIIEERRSLREKISHYSDNAARWLSDQVEAGSYDVLALTIYLPL